MGEGYGLFVSPHPDDVVWSAFSSLTGFSGEKVVVTLFNRSKYFLGSYLDQTFVPAVTFWRTLEDKVALSLLGAKPLHLCLPDTSVRGRTDFGRSIRLEPLEGAPAAIFSPLGVGGHPDHLYARRVALEAWLRLGRRPRLTFYEDLPYAAWMSGAERAEGEIVEELSQTCGRLVVGHLPLTQTQMRLKILMSKLYVSQEPPIRALFGRGKQLGALIGAHYAERVVVAQKGL